MLRPSLLLLALALPWEVGEAQDSPLEVQVIGQVLEGKERPAVVVLAHASVTALKIELERSGCGAGPSKVAFSLPRLGAGHRQRFELDQPVGRCGYQGTLSARVGGQEASMPIQFKAEVVAPPSLSAPSIDEASHTVTVTFSRAADHALVEAYGEDGRKLSSTETPLDRAPAGDALSLPYGAPGAVLKIRVQVFDRDGLFAGMDLFPWSLRIPHQEVVFATGSAAVPATEIPKLAESLAQISAALKRVGDQAPLRLFVAGYTDTVGGEEQNLTLSKARAQSIGAYFRAHGVRVPILAAGLGEQALLVATADETPEARNRRAEYILSVDAPAIAGAPRAPDWIEQK
jgi:outer membrane protein OmpA-like peptidoglycan-associated protein